MTKYTHVVFISIKYSTVKEYLTLMIHINLWLWIHTLIFSKIILGSHLGCPSVQTKPTLTGFYHVCSWLTLFFLPSLIPPLFSPGSLVYFRLLSLFPLSVPLHFNNLICYNHRHSSASTNILYILFCFSFSFGWQKLHCWKLTCKVDSHTVCVS